MSKVLIIGDLHIGARNNSSVLLSYMKNYFQNELFPLIKERGITHVIQLGDTLDKRKSIDFTTSAFLIKEWLSWFDTNNVTLYAIIGNHDTYYKTTNEVSGIKQYESLFKNVKIIDVPTNIIMDKTQFTLIPWINDENKAECISAITAQKKAEYNIVCGHFEMAGMPMLRNVLSKSGTVEFSDFENVDKVYSGHYHTPSAKNNVEYLGTPYELTWADYGDKKCVTIVDTENPSEPHEKIYTKKSLFKKIFFNESNTDIPSLVDGSFVKIILNEPSEVVEVFANKLSEQNHLSQCQIIDLSTSNASDTEEELDTIELDDPFHILMSSISNIDNPFISQELYSIYNEARLQEKE